MARQGPSRSFIECRIISLFMLPNNSHCLTLGHTHRVSNADPSGQMTAPIRNESEGAVWLRERREMEKAHYIIPPHRQVHAPPRGPGRPPRPPGGQFYDVSWAGLLGVGQGIKGKDTLPNTGQNEPQTWVSSPALPFTGPGLFIFFSLNFSFLICKVRTTSSSVIVIIRWEMARSRPCHTVGVRQVSVFPLVLGYVSPLVARMDPLKTSRTREGEPFGK